MFQNKAGFLLIPDHPHLRTEGSKILFEVIGNTRWIAVKSAVWNMFLWDTMLFSKTLRMTIITSEIVDVCNKMEEDPESNRSEMDVSFSADQVTNASEKQDHCNREVCDKQFTRKEGISTHPLSCTREKPYHCTICEKMFSTKGHLNSHILIHTGETPYQCKICLKRFSVKSSLNSHLFIHTREKPYNCKVCDKRFSWKGNLNQHLLIHTGENRTVVKYVIKSFPKKNY